ncbi:hypothetical protein Tco_1457271 [Tanacetum coccineum]
MPRLIRPIFEGDAHDDTYGCVKGLLVIDESNNNLRLLSNVDARYQKVRECACVIVEMDKEKMTENQRDCFTNDTFRDRSLVSSADEQYGDTLGGYRENGVKAVISLGQEKGARRK